MALKLNLFVHGVPKGQKIWGPQEEDRIFLESFYSRRSTEEAQMQVDVMKIGKDVYCYFTYLRGGNILDIDNRPGSYFALTIRVNACYIDLSNIYNILHTSYKKFILDKILTSNESSSKYLVADFQQCDDTLKSLEKEIINYLSSFSNNSDFVNLDNFATNSRIASQNINLLECNNKNVLTYIKEKGSVSVSPIHPSNQFLEYTRKKEEEFDKLKQEAQKLVGEEKRKSEQQIQLLKAEYLTADKKIADLNRQVEIEKSNAISLKQKFELNEQEYIKIQTFNAAKLKEAENRINDFKNKQPENTNNSELKNAAKLLPPNYYLFLITVLLTLLILLGFVFFSVKQSIDNDRINKDINSKVDVINKKIDVITNLLNSEKKSENNTTVKQTIQPTEPVKGAAGSAGTKKNPAKPAVPKKKIQSPEKSTTNQNN
jgi:hypothetical protein